MSTHAEVIAKTFAESGVEHVFGLPGGEIVAFMDACRRAGIRFVLTGHESSAAWMAQVVGEIRWHQFPPPGGITGLALLSESHLTCHTYPEFRAATFNLYCCRNRDSWSWETTLKEMLGATEVNVRVFERLIQEDAHSVAGAAK